MASLGLNRQMAERGLQQAAETPGMGPFLSGEDLHISTVEGIKGMVRAAGASGFLVVELGAGNRWWSTRLYLLAVLLQNLTDVRQLVFSKEDGSFAAMASPSATRQGLRDSFDQLGQFDAGIRERATEDLDREIDRVVASWGRSVGMLEAEVKVDVRWQLLQRWIGESLIRRAVRIDPTVGMTLTDIQNIVESLVPDVPVDWPRPTEESAATGHSGRLMVVDRDGFALAIARQWVATSLPRAAGR